MNVFSTAVRVLPVAFLAMLLPGMVTSAHAQFSPIRMRVDVVSDREFEKSKSSDKSKTAGSQRTGVTATHSLEISLRNLSQKDYASVTVKYWLFARDYDRDTVVLAVSGETTVDLAALSSQTVTTRQAKLSLKEKGGDKKKDSKVVRSRSGNLSGRKFHGFGVQVLDGTAVLAQEFSPPDLKDEVVLN
jgi:hypothetical protein